MLWGNQKYKNAGVAWGRPLAALMALFTVILAIAQVVVIFNQPAKKRKEIVSKDQRYLTAGVEVAGSYVAETFPSSSILLITKPTTESNKDRNKSIIQAVNLGLNGRYKKLFHESPRPPISSILNNKPGAEDDVVFTAENLELMLRLHPETNLILSLVGLPEDLKNVKLWKTKPKVRPKFVVMFPDSVFQLKPYIKKGLISAVITYNVRFKPNFKEELPDDSQEIFNKRFILFDSENIEKFAADNPNMFMVEKEEDEEENEGD